MKRLTLLLFGTFLSLAGFAFSGGHLPCLDAGRAPASSLRSTHFDGARFETMGGGVAKVAEEHRGRECTEILVDCYHAGSDSIDQCVKSAPLCEEALTGLTIAQCCSADGVRTYQARRAQGQTSLTAFDFVYN